MASSSSPRNASQTTPSTARRWRVLAPRTIQIGLASALGLFLLIQFVPYGRAHTNPAVAAEPAWDSANTRALFVRACADCHSNETTWPWYSNVAPVSWLVYHDVQDGRRSLNISEWGLQRNKADEAAKTVQKGEMPPWFFTPIHPEANLSASEKQALIAGLIATFGSEGESGSAPRGVANLPAAP